MIHQDRDNRKPASQAGIILIALLFGLTSSAMPASAQNAGESKPAGDAKKAADKGKGATPDKAGDSSKGSSDKTKPDKGTGATEGAAPKVKEGSVVNRPTWTFRSAEVTVTVTQLDTYMPGWRRFRVKAQLTAKGKERCTVTGRLTLLPDEKTQPDRDGASRGRGTIYVKVPPNGVGSMTLTVKESGDWQALKVDTIKLFEFWLD